MNSGGYWSLLLLLNLRLSDILNDLRLNNLSGNWDLNLRLRDGLWDELLRLDITDWLLECVKLRLELRELRLESNLICG